LLQPFDMFYRMSVGDFCAVNGFEVSHELLCILHESVVSGQ
jgi:hypothetical protein